jgi:hypothetical protein
MKSGTGLRRWGHRRYKTSGGFGDGEATGRHATMREFISQLSALNHQLQRRDCLCVIRQ